jgi:hypothetical protein
MPVIFKVSVESRDGLDVVPAALAASILFGVTVAPKEVRQDPPTNLCG